ncbi:MAG: GntR family transcriptional regulator [Gemmobacter sp.]|nr:GntR family transcriptional regulator [Gemmobacter sp.]
MRAVLAHLTEAGILSWDGRQKLLLRAPRPEDRFDADETRPRQELVEGPFLDWVLQGDLPPGTTINEAELARRFDVPVATVREFLIRFEPFGLIEKRPNRHWVLNGFTRDFAEEMFAVREMFERRALAGLLAGSVPGGPLRPGLLALRSEHCAGAGTGAGCRAGGVSGAGCAVSQPALCGGAQPLYRGFQPDDFDHRAFSLSLEQAG